MVCSPEYSHGQDAMYVAYLGHTKYPAVIDEYNALLQYL